VKRWLVPEVVQSSAMDCGPVSLKSLLEGFGIHASYGRLREACQTSVDGTSIDALEETAIALGLDGGQIMAPADHFVLLR
jgi:ATP-binding cassette subfamily B protein